MSCMNSATSRVTNTEAQSIAVVNARVWTGDGSRRWADALLANGDRIAAVGSSAEVMKRVTQATRVIDARGMLVVPGFIDAHIQFLLGGFGLSLVNSFRRIVSPGLVLAYAALEGLFVGAFSKVIEAQFGGGIVIGAVLGTFAAVAGTLAAYKFFNIQVGTRFRTWVIAAMFGFVAISLLNFVLSFFGAGFGFNGYGTMGLISSVVGLALGVLMLILDFDFVERGIAAGLPERETWRAAFGLAVTIIWIYIELLRILAILRGSD